MVLFQIKPDSITSIEKTVDRFRSTKEDILGAQSIKPSLKYCLTPIVASEMKVDVQGQL